MHCYCISGLGADQRIFSRLALPGFSLHYLPWLLPNPGESIEAYAGRMKEGIRHPNAVLIGVSFGGMLAIEIAKTYAAATVVQVSSIRSKKQRPAWMTTSGRLHLERLVSIRDASSKSLIRQWISPIENHFLGAETKEDSRLLREYRNQTDRHYIRWAIDRIFHWKNEWTPASFWQVHGGRDRIFPLASRDVTHFIPDGGHLMIFNRPEAVGERLAGILAGQPYP